MRKSRLLRANGRWIACWLVFRSPCGKILKAFIAPLFLQTTRELSEEKKETLSDKECILIFDFAETYTFMVQDAIQSFHLNNTQAMMHPFFINYKQDGTLKHKSLMCISDMLQHDVHTVCAFQKTIIFNVLTKDLPQVENVIYFSEYKNHKNFTNLLHQHCNYVLHA